jgi:hypothetical protein
MNISMDCAIREDKSAQEKAEAVDLGDERTEYCFLLNIESSSGRWPFYLHWLTGHHRAIPGNVHPTVQPLRSRVCVQIHLVAEHRRLSEDTDNVLKLQEQ